MKNLQNIVMFALLGLFFVEKGGVGADSESYVPVSHSSSRSGKQVAKIVTGSVSSDTGSHKAIDQFDSYVGKLQDEHSALLTKYTAGLTKQADKQEEILNMTRKHSERRRRADLEADAEESKKQIEREAQRLHSDLMGQLYKDPFVGFFKQKAIIKSQVEDLKDIIEHNVKELQQKQGRLVSQINNDVTKEALRGKVKSIFLQNLQIETLMEHLQDLQKCVANFLTAIEKPVELPEDV